MKAREIFEYNKLTWPEMNDAIELGKVVLLPTGSTEQHGAHLPLDTDLFLVESVCQELGRRAPDKVLVLPGIPYGLNMTNILDKARTALDEIASSVQKAFAAGP